MKKRMIILSLFAVFVLLSCPQGVFDDLGVPGAGVPETDPVAGLTESADPVDLVDMGNIRMQVPLISSYLAKAMGITYTAPTSRAFMIISKVEFTLYDSLDAVVDFWTYAPADPADEGPSGSTEGPLDTRTVPAAEGYTLLAEVFNDHVDPGTALLSDTSAAFNITSGGSTDVTVRPVPVSPTAASAGGGSPVDVFPTYDTGETRTIIVDYGDDGVEGGTDGDADTTMDIPIYAWGEEHWFEIDATGLDIMEVTVTPDASSASYIMVADSQGSVKTTMMSGGGDGSSGVFDYGVDAVVTLLSPDTTYYVGAITIIDGSPPVPLPIDDSTDDGTVDISFALGIDDGPAGGLDTNDIWTSAVTIEMATTVDGIDLDELDRDGDDAVNYVGGDWYKFMLTGSDDPSDVDVRLVYDSTQGRLDVWLFGEDGSQIAHGEEADPDPDPDVGQKDIADQMLVLDTQYYILVGTDYNQPVGLPYQLEWLAGTGDLNIGME